MYHVSAQGVDERMINVQWPVGEVPCCGHGFKGIPPQTQHPGKPINVMLQ